MKCGQGFLGFNNVLRRPPSSAFHKSLKGGRESKFSGGFPPLPAERRNSGGGPAFISPYSPLLHGSHRAGKGFFAEPLEAWLAILASAVPFYQDSLVVCPSGMAEERARGLWARAKEHLPQAHFTQLRPREICKAPATNPIIHTSSAQLSLSAECGKPSQEGNSALVSAPSEASSSSLSTLSSPPPPSVYVSAEIEQMPAHSLDLIVLAGNVFAEEMLFDAPWHLSNAYRLLRPHGVLAIVGYSPYLQVVAPSWAAEDAGDYLKELFHACGEDCRQEYSKLNSRKAPSSSKVSSRRLKELQRALDILESEMVGHEDVFFPFKAVQRRWLDSEYAMSPAEVVASFRAMHIYKLLYADEVAVESMDVVKAHPHSVDTSSSLLELRSGEYANSNSVDSDFIELVLNDPEDSLSDLDNAEDKPILNARRRRCLVDPLDALEDCWKARLAISEGVISCPQKRKSRFEMPPLRVQVKHFAVTLSNRSMNATPHWRDPAASLSNESLKQLR